MKRFAFLVACVAALAVAAPASAAAPVANGDFETGDLTGWTTFLTDNGQISPAPAVVLFDTTGSGESNAARFAVGRNSSFFSAPAGGGIYQSVNTAAGSFNLSADIAALAGGEQANLSCGLFELLVDGIVVDSHDFAGVPGTNDFSQCPAYTTVRATLSASELPLTTGLHEIRIRITRPGTLSPTVAWRPRQYVDNVLLTQLTAAMPTTRGECKNGGWRTYPVFKNQGACVSYVFSGKTTPPANG